MSYNPYTAVNEIYKLKGQWDNANKNGDETKKSEAATKAQEYYNQLKSYRYNDVADELKAADYTQAKKIRDKWAKMDKTPTRDYLYTLGKGRGMSKEEVDSIIGWDNDTGQLSIGGKVVGTPDTVVDGVSYWKDTKVLDNAFDDYITRSGTTRSKEAMVDQENESLFKKYNQHYEDLNNTNPFETDVGKSILAKYGLSAMQGRDNEAATAASSNGGNIDSFAAANALRQQSALIAKGQEVALNAHMQKLEHARSILSDMGYNIDRVFNQNETAKNNQVARDVSTSEVTGYVPENMSYSYNPFLNNDGTVKDAYKNVDIQGEFIDPALEKLKTETDPKEIEKLNAIVNYGAQARVQKMEGDDRYKQYAGTGTAYLPNKTANYKLTEQQLKDALEISKGEQTNEVEKIKAQTAGEIAINDAATQNEKELRYEKEKYSNDEDTVWNEFVKGFKEGSGARQFVNDHIKVLFDNNTEIDAEKLKNLIENNALKYSITPADAQKIVSAFGGKTDWIASSDAFSAEDE